MDNPTPSTPLSDEAVTLLANFKAIDPLAKGTGLDRIAPFYPKVGWTVILARVKELEDAGKVARKPVMNAKGRVGYHLYTWKEA